MTGSGPGATELYLVRHGQTACTAHGLFCGRHDPPMTPAGLAMARAAGGYHSAAAWQACYASPSLRALQTATEIVAPRSLRPEVDSRLAELDYGAWDGRTVREVSATAAYQRWLADPAGTAPPGGETGAGVAARAVPAVEEIVARHAGGTVLLVSHKATIRLVVCHYLGIPLRDFRRRLALPASSVTRLRVTVEGAMLVSIGSVDHLPPPWRGDPDQMTFTLL